MAWCKYEIFHIYRDAGGFEAWYEAISVIEYKGSMNSYGETQGHYLCDIKDKVTKVWFRTNHNTLPIPIRISDVSQYGYIVLVKRV